MKKTAKYSYGTPEVKECYFCHSRLIPDHKASDKKVYFSKGNLIRIKHLVYKCSNDACSRKDFLYRCLSMQKLAPKGSTYSYKVLLMIYYYKYLGFSREQIQEKLERRGIKTSSKTIYNLYKNYMELKNSYYPKLVEKYNKLYEEFKQIKLTIDYSYLGYKRYGHLIVRDGFYGNIIVFKDFYNYNNNDIINYLKELFISEYNINEVMICPELDFAIEELSKKSQVKHFAFPE